MRPGDMVPLCQAKPAVANQQPCRRSSTPSRPTSWRAIQAVDDSAVEDLPVTLHGVAGVLRTYQLHEAHAEITRLRAVVAQPGHDATTVEQGRQEAVDRLRLLLVEPGDGTTP